MNTQKKIRKIYAIILKRPTALHQAHQMDPASKFLAVTLSPLNFSGMRLQAFFYSQKQESALSIDVAFTGRRFKDKKK